MILLIRHAVALPRETWVGDDELRPLNERGLRQAKLLPELLAPYEVGRVLSSPAVRCTATVAPLAAHRELSVVRAPELAEGNGSVAAEYVLGLDDGVALCTHGDVAEDVLDAVALAGWPIPRTRPCAKGSTWLLDPTDRAVYLTPPA